jgi:hypothetical protein
VFIHKLRFHRRDAKNAEKVFYDHNNTIPVLLKNEAQRILAGGKGGANDFTFFVRRRS